MTLKVSKSQKQIMASWILPKNECWDNFVYWILSQGSFFGRIQDTIFFFKIYWPLVSNVKYVIFFFKFSEYMSFINYETQKPLNCYFVAYAPYWIGEKSRSSGMKESWFNKIDVSFQKAVTKISFKKFIMKRCPFLRSSLD